MVDKTVITYRKIEKFVSEFDSEGPEKGPQETKEWGEYFYKKEKA
jgi:hypothetical protein